MIMNGARHLTYYNQRLLVPANQVEEVQKAFPNKTVVSSVGSREIKSKPLDKMEAKKLQEEALSGKWNDLNWNKYKTKDLAIGIGKQAGYAAIQGVAIRIGMEIATKVWNGEEIKGKEIVEQALVSGADFGIKAATAGALKVGVEKGIVKVLPKGTPAGTIANIAYVAIENIKILKKVAIGELTLTEVLEKIEQTSVASIAGISASVKGTMIGAAIGTIFGPVGAVIGGFVGGTVGYIAGSKIAEACVKGYQKVRKKSIEIVKEVGESVISGVKETWNDVRNFARSLLSW